jgi:hypothetical protein
MQKNLPEKWIRFETSFRRNNCKDAAQIFQRSGAVIFSFSFPISPRANDS